MSCQPSPQPQASGTAAATASSGTTTNNATRERSRKELGSGSISGSGPGAGLAGVPGAAGVPGGPVTRVPGDAVMGGSSLCSGRHGRGFTLRAGNYAYVTVTYESVGYAGGSRPRAARAGLLAPGRGFEPRFNGPKPLVLPG